MDWLRIEGSLHIGLMPAETLLPYLCDRLREVKARRITVTDHAVSFRGGMFRFVGKWNVLVPFGHGELMVDEQKRELRYRLSIRQMVLLVTFVVAAATIAAWVGLQTGPGILLVSAVGWIWLVGGNLLIGIPRFKRFLRKAVDCQRDASPLPW